MALPTTSATARIPAPPPRGRSAPAACRGSWRRAPPPRSGTPARWRTCRCAWAGPAPARGAATGRATPTASRTSRPTTTPVSHQGTCPFTESAMRAQATQELVGGRVEEGAQHGLLAEQAGGQAVERVGGGGHREGDERTVLVPLEVQPEEDRREDDPRRRQHVRDVEAIRAPSSPPRGILAGPVEAPHQARSRRPRSSTKGPSPPARRKGFTSASSPSSVASGSTPAARAARTADSRPAAAWFAGSTPSTNAQVGLGVVVARVDLEARVEPREAPSGRWPASRAGSPPCRQLPHPDQKSVSPVRSLPRHSSSTDPGVCPGAGWIRSAQRSPGRGPPRRRGRGPGGTSPRRRRGRSPRRRAPPAGGRSPPSGRRGRGCARSTVGELRSAGPGRAPPPGRPGPPAPRRPPRRAGRGSCPSRSGAARRSRLLRPVGQGHPVPLRVPEEEGERGAAGQAHPGRRGASPPTPPGRPSRW